MAKRSTVFRGLTALTAAFFAVFSVGSTVATEYESYINSALGTQTSAVETPDEEDSFTYTSDYATTQELVDADIALSEEIAEEGAVLLKNNDDVLPIASDSKVSLVGMSAYEPQLGGIIGSAVSDNSSINEDYANVDLKTALEEQGIEINADLDNAYANIDTNGTIGYRSLSGLGMTFGTVTESETYVVNEVSQEELETASPGITTSSFGEYNTAIVVIARTSSEGNNMTPGNVSEEDFADTEGKNPLSLTDDEMDMIEMAKNNVGDDGKVIVLLNSNNALEVDALQEDDDIDAIVWIGTTGSYGMRGIVDVLTGETVPSGHLTDTYAVNSALAPAAINSDVYIYANYEEISIENGETYMGYTYENDTGSADSLRGMAYEVQAESIYIGYKYYETRYADTVYGNGNASEITGDGTDAVAGADSWVYEDEVTYSFGYGLSYVDFTQELVSVDVDLASKTVTAVVNVTNNDDELSAKSVVQLYVALPYTQYDIDNGVEKAAIQLLDYGKTDLLAPGETQTITIEADMTYMASYDTYGQETYILDDGDYYFAIGNGAHDALNNVLAAQGYTTEDGMDYDGDGSESAVQMWTNDTFDATTFATSDNGTQITNQLEDADLNYYIEGAVTYLSRSDWTGTWPKEYVGIEVTEEMITQLRNRTYEVEEGEESDTVWGEDNGLILASLKGADYEDEQWDDLLDEITIEEAIEIIEFGGASTWTLDSIQNPEAKQSDGPNGFNGSSIGAVASGVDSDPCLVDDDDPNKGYTFGTMPNAPLIGASFSKELAAKIGAHLGNESLWTGTPLIWGMGGNLHRSAYIGRAHEYYSEDSVLVCLTMETLVASSRDYGVVLGAKHFAFNNTEYNRYGLSTYFTEQAARENELRAFQGAYEDGGALAMMTAFNRVGATYLNGHTGLMQNILRGEWGYTGIASTDILNSQYYQVLAESIMGGVCMIANSSTRYTADGEYWAYASAEMVTGDADLLEQLKTNMHYLWWAYANSNALNGMTENSTIVTVTPWWKAALQGGTYASAALAILFAVLYVVIYIKDDKKKAA